MTLTERVERVLTIAPYPMTVEQIARTVRTRTSEVRAVLASSRFSVESNFRGRVLYTLSGLGTAAPNVGDGQPGPGRAMRPGSHCAKVLAALSDGEWWTTAELYRRCGGMVLHSRISELRKRGYAIEHEHVPGKSGAQGSRYRLLHPLPEGGADSPPQAPTAPPSFSEQMELYARNTNAAVRYLNPHDKATASA